MLTQFMLILIILAISVQPVIAGEIHEAILQGEYSQVEQLIAANPELATTPDERDCTPLHYAANNGDLEIAQLILKYEVDLNKKDADGDTPLHWAASTGQSAFLKMLIENGADLNSINDKGWFPIYWAITQGYPEAAGVLLDAGAKINPKGEDGQRQLFAAARFGMAAIVDHFLEQGADPRGARPDGVTFLHCAAAGGLIETVRELLNSKHDPNTQTIFGVAPIHEAAQSGNEQVLRILLRNGAAIDLKTYAGKTAYHFAKETRNESLMAFLTDAGADTSDYDYPLLPARYPDQNEPGLTPQLFAPGIISTPDYNERDMAFTPDLAQLYFTRYARAHQLRMTIHTMHKKNEAWTEAEIAPFSGQYPDAELFIDHDGRDMYFISQRPDPTKKEPNSWEMWHIRRTASGWNEPQLMDSLFSGCFYPTTTTTGDMYVTHPDQDLYRARLVNGQFQTLEHLGPTINSDNAEYNDLIAPDGSYIVFTSMGWGAKNGDLFVSFHNDDDTWTPPINMGGGINSDRHDYCPALSPDGQFFFFSSNRYGTEDIFWVKTKVIENLREHLPEK